MSQDYKDTMNLPQTEFPMRGNLTANEPLRLKKWREMDLYGLMLQKNEGNEPYVLHDGPPYANGPIHMGHAFNKVLKDIIVKYKTLRGFYAPYVPGWDCHGQPIEHMVETKLGPEKMAEIDQPTLRRLCRQWAENYVRIQGEGFQRLGVLGQWDDPYLTYVPSYEAGNVEIFKEMYERGAIYRGRKPIHWCRHCHTALAEAEIEYGDERSPSIYVAFELVASDLATSELAASELTTSELASGLAASELATSGLVASENAKQTYGLPNESAKKTYGLPARIEDVLPAARPPHILIWTTTPWTLPANSGVTLAANADYAFLLAENKTLIVALELAEAVSSALGLTAGFDIPAPLTLLRDAEGKPLTVKGSELFNLSYHHPIHEGMRGRVVTGAHVELGTGTGAVHTAPGHGQEDYLMGVEYDLPLLMPVDDNGVFDAGGGPFEGLNVNEANPAIVAWLRERGTLAAEASITHSYPHCWRCHNPVIFRATDQWFVSMAATGLRENAIAETARITWYPGWAVNRMRSMLEGRPDWCISRQRSWGVPIPVFKCAACSATVATPETFDAIIELFSREGADAWFTRKPKEYLPAGTVCGVCGSDELVPERDILDVWWESGVSHTSVLKKREQLCFPAELYLEGSDQHRGWFQSSLLTSVGAYGLAPYKGVMSCGFVVDGEGNKMSKSRGNVIDPLEVVAKYGADVLRLWVGSIDYSQDVGINDEIIQRTSEGYRRIRNTFRFLLSNLYDFSWDADRVCWDELNAIDRWALVRCMRLTAAVTEAFEAFRFHVAFHAIYDYIVTDLSAIYLDVLKDRLYSDAPKSLARRGAQTALCNILEALVRMLAPILTFTCDEVWEHYPEGIRPAGGKGDGDAGDRADKDNRTVLLAGWPEAGDFAPLPTNPDEVLRIEREFKCILAVREAVTKALEEARNAKVIGKSQEATLKLVVDSETYAVLLAQAAGMLEELFIVASVEIKLGEPDSLAGVMGVTGVAGVAGAANSAGTMAATGMITVEVLRADGEKCPRCWNIRELGTDEIFGEVCARCAAVLKEREVL